MKKLTSRSNGKSGERDLAVRIRHLRPGEVITVSSAIERGYASRVGKILHSAGVIKRKLISKPNGKGGYNISLSPL